MSTDATVEATRESADDIKTKADFVRLWVDAIELASKEEEKWRDRADEVVKLYRNERKAGDVPADSDRRFNILFSNVETTVPAIYNSTPIPDVRRRYADQDKVGKEVSDLIERAISYSVDSYDFDDTMVHAAYDGELTGRAVTRIRYMPYVSGEEGEEEVAYEEVLCEHVPWKHFRRGPGRTWPDVPWVAFELFLTRDELVKLSPKFGNRIELDCEIERADKKDGDNPPEVFKRARVWEIWDKNTRRVIFIATGFKDQPIREEADPLDLEQFFPVPRPLYAIRTTDSLVPVAPYYEYKDQAEELERVTRRIMAITEAMKVRAAYDGRAMEIARLAEAEDNTLEPVENVTVFADGSDLTKKIMWWPIEVLVVALKQLYEAREQIKQTIYEITGVSDILRGQTDPNETLGAQQIKTQWGSLRIQRKQAEIARYARDLFRLKAEIIANKFSWQTITMMTGLNYPPQQAKQQAQLIAQQAQQTGQPIPPEVKQVLDLPAQEEVEQVLRNDASRGFRIDVESDSTIRADMTRNQQNMSLFLQGTAQYAAAMGPIVMADKSMMPAAMEVFGAFARNFRLGKQAEDAIDNVTSKAKDLAEQPQQQQPNPQLEVEMAKAKNEQAKMQMDLQLKGEEHRMKIEMMNADLQKKQAELELERQKLDMKRQEMEMDAAMAQQKSAMDAQAQEREFANQQRQADLNAQAAEHKHQLGVEMMDRKAEQQKAAAKKPRVNA